MVSTALDSLKPIPLDEDLILVDRYLSGDQSGFEGLYRKYYEKVFAIARGVLLDADEAADAVQEVFTLVFKNLSRFDRRSRFSTWLFRIAVNRSIQHARSNRHKNKSVELNEYIAYQDEEIPTSQDDAQIHETLAKLLPSDRAILTLFYWEELSLQEIAESMGCGVNAAKTRLYRARERFRELFEAAGA